MGVGDYREATNSAFQPFHRNRSDSIAACRLNCAGRGTRNLTKPNAVGRPGWKNRWAIGLSRLELMRMLRPERFGGRLQCRRPLGWSLVPHLATFGSVRQSSRANLGGAFVLAVLYRRFGGK